MTIQDIKLDIQSKHFKPFYIFTGEEWQVQKIYIHKIAEISGNEAKYIDSINEIYSNLKSVSLIKQCYTYVLRDDKEILTNEKVQEQLNEQLLSNNILILLLSTIDKRTKFYNKFKDKIIEFEKLDDDILTKYIQKEIDLDIKDCKKLISICENDYSRILLEIDKIKKYVDGCVREYGKPCDVEIGEVFQSLINNRAIYQPPYDAIFDFVDAVLRKKVNLSFNLLSQCKEVGENTFAILTVLYNNAKQLLQVQACESRDIQGTTGLTPYIIKLAKEKQGIYKNGELVYMMKLIQETEKAIKIGLLDEEIAIERILVNCL